MVYFKRTHACSQQPPQDKPSSDKNVHCCRCCKACMCSLHVQLHPQTQVRPPKRTPPQPPLAAPWDITGHTPLQQILRETPHCIVKHAAWANANRFITLPYAACRRRPASRRCASAAPAPAPACVPAPRRVGFRVPPPLPCPGPEPSLLPFVGPDSTAMPPAASSGVPPIAALEKASPTPPEPSPLVPAGWDPAAAAPAVPLRVCSAVSLDQVSATPSEPPVLALPLTRCPATDAASVPEA